MVPALAAKGLKPVFSSVVVLARSRFTVFRVAASVVVAVAPLAAAVRASTTINLPKCLVPKFRVAYAVVSK